MIGIDDLARHERLYIGENTEEEYRIESWDTGGIGMTHDLKIKRPRAVRPYLVIETNTMKTIRADIE